MLRFADGFDKYGAAADLALRASLINNTGFGATDGRWGGGAPNVSNWDSTTRFVVPFSAVNAGNAIHAALHVRPGGSINSLTNAHWFGFKGSGGNDGGIGINSGVARVYKFGSPSTGIADLSPNPFSANTWSHVEIAALFHASAGYFKVWVEGVLIVDFSGSTSSITPENIIEFYMCDGTSFSVTRYDDLVIWDEQGSGLVTTHLGRHRITTLTPDGAGSNTDFVPNSGANYAAVDESAFHDGDTSYVDSSVIGDKDSYTTGNMGTNPITIHGVQVSVRGKDLGSIAGIKPMVRSGSTELSGDEGATTTSYKQISHLFTQDPDTSAAWTVSGVNGMEIGIDHSA